MRLQSNPRSISRNIGATYAWDEGDVVHNVGPFYVGGDPFMPGTSMFLDELKVYARPLSELDLASEAGTALGAAGPHFIKLGCGNCTQSELEASCSEYDDYHPCLCQELMGGGLLSARVNGWLRGASSNWHFHSVVQNKHACKLFSGYASLNRQMGFCCHD